MSNAPLADPSDVEDLWRPLNPDETDRVENLVAKASAKLRSRVLYDIDARIAAYNRNPADPAGLDPVVVADVVASVVKRFLVNQDGAASTSETVGPFSRSTSFAGRNDTDARGVLEVTDADLAQLTRGAAYSGARTIRTTPTFSPCPVAGAEI